MEKIVNNLFKGDVEQLRKNITMLAVSTCVYPQEILQLSKELDELIVTYCHEGDYWAN